MEIIHIEEKRNGVQKDILEIHYRDCRYEDVEQVMFLSLKDANELLVKLDEKIASIPY